MTKIRVHELAKELDISSKELITILMNEFNVEVKNHMSVVDDEDAELIKELFIENAKQQTTVENKEMAVEAKKGIVQEYEEILEEEVLNVKIKKNKKQEAEAEVSKEQKIAAEKAKDFAILEIDKTITVKEIAERFNKPTNEVMKQLMFVGVMASMNQEIDFNTAQKLAEKFEFKLVLKETENLGVAEEEEDLFDDKEVGTKRPPVVTVMGHVDHGKTSLLDSIKKSKVTESEAGGITQHIGAYTVNVNGEKITFLDTPGHEAFTAMRARGAQITDIVILVVAADDGLMPQTIEAINHCKAANVPIIVAINKIDKAGANVENVKQELTQYGLVSEDWGGDTICLPVSARTKEGIDELLEMVVLTAEIQELTANANRHAKGTVIEAKLDKQRGPVASLLVQNGTLHVGDSILVGSTYGRIRAMFDDKGKKLKMAGPSIPVEILGLSEVPAAGDRFIVVKNEKTARDMAEERQMKLRSEYLQSTHKVSLEDLYNQIKEGKIKELGLIVKADVQGSLEAIRQTLEKLSNESVKVRVIHGAVGTITETDINLASSSNAIIIGFNVRPDTNALLLADKEAVEIKTYSIIYNAIDDIKAAMEGMLEPEYKEVILGRTEIRQIYKVSNVGTIAGCYVLDGKITRGSSIRLLRSGIIILDGTLNSLKRFKDDAKEVAAGFECGLSIEKYNDIREGDIIEAYEMQEIKPKA